MEYKLTRTKVHGILVTEEAYDDEKTIGAYPVEFDRNFFPDTDKDLGKEERVAGLIQNPNLFHVYAEIEFEGHAAWVSLGYDSPEDEYDRRWDEIAQKEIARFIKKWAKVSHDNH